MMYRTRIGRLSLDTFQRRKLIVLQQTLYRRAQLRQLSGSICLPAISFRMQGRHTKGRDLRNVFVDEALIHVVWHTLGAASQTL